jgi:hypothetical protein
MRCSRDWFLRPGVATFVARTDVVAVSTPAGHETIVRKDWPPRRISFVRLVVRRDRIAQKSQGFSLNALTGGRRRSGRQGDDAFVGMHVGEKVAIHRDRYLFVIFLQSSVLSWSVFCATRQSSNIGPADASVRYRFVRYFSRRFSRGDVACAASDC